MQSLFRKCVFFLIAAVPVFSQSETAHSRVQGLYTGDPFWRQALGGAVLSLPDLQEQSAVVALDGGNIRAYSTAGTPMWNYSARGRISPFVTRSREGTSYFSRINGTLIAINRTGRELWRRNIGDPLCAKVVPGWDGRLFVPTEKKISCFTAAGTLLWTRTFESPFFIAPKLDRGGGIILTLENNEACRIDPFGNINKWVLSNKPAGLLSIDKQRIIAIYSDGSMEILGTPEEWFFSAQSDAHSVSLPRLPSGPAAAVCMGNNIAAVLNDGRVSFVSLDERKILWNGDSHIREIIKNGGSVEPEVEMIFDERGIYILSKNGASGFSHDGKRLWFTFLQNMAAVPAFGNDGVLYSGGKDWILYAYKVENRGLPERRSIYGPVPEGVYGTGLPQSSFSPDFPINEHELKFRLEQFSEGINTGRVESNEPAWTSLLMMIATSQFHIQYRINALRLLGQMGSQETVPWLVNFFRRENEPPLKAAAAAAIGAIGVDPDGTAIQTFLFLLVNGGGIKDEQVLLAITKATGDLCRFSGPPLSETGVKILTMLTAQNQPPVVSRQANREITSLKQ
jgi:outer membrane protein assembly factor BamB